MGRRVALKEILDKHDITCPRCRRQQAVVLLDATFEMQWQCIDCEYRWPIDEEESSLLFDSKLKTVH
jgi:hypothetical protein